VLEVCSSWWNGCSTNRKPRMLEIRCLPRNCCIAVFSVSNKYMENARYVFGMIPNEIIVTCYDSEERAVF
jgi:hypothetical protein